MLRGTDESIGPLFSHAGLETRIPSHRPLRKHETEKTALGAGMTFAKTDRPSPKSLHPG